MTPEQRKALTINKPQPDDIDIIIPTDGMIKCCCCGSRPSEIEYDLEVWCEPCWKDYGMATIK